MSTAWNSSNYCFQTSAGALSEWDARALAILETVKDVREWQPPKVSIGRGRKEMPCCWQASELCLDFLSKAFDRAAPGCSLALWRRACCRGETTVTSNYIIVVFKRFVRVSFSIYVSGVNIKMFSIVRISCLRYSVSDWVTDLSVRVERMGQHSPP